MPSTNVRLLLLAVISAFAATNCKTSADAGPRTEKRPVSFLLLTINPSLELFRHTVESFATSAIDEQVLLRAPSKTVDIVRAPDICICTLTEDTGTSSSNATENGSSDSDSETDKDISDEDTLSAEGSDFESEVEVEVDGDDDEPDPPTTNSLFVPCLQCGESFCDTGQLAMHRYRVHRSWESDTAAPPLSTGEFQVRASQSSEKQRSGSGKRHRCEFCRRVFFSRLDLTSHLFIHTGKTPFRCNPCDTSFSHKKCLKKHIHNHGRKNTFALESTLRKHQAIRGSPAVPRIRRRKPRPIEMSDSDESGSTP